MATATFPDINDLPVLVELPLAPGRAAAAASRPFVLASEDFFVLQKAGTRGYGTTQRLAIGSVSAATAAGITAEEIMLHASSRCFVKTGATPTAVVDGDSIPLEPGEKFHLRITSGHKVAVIRDIEDGFLHISAVI